MASTELAFRVVGVSQWAMSTAPDGSDARVFLGSTEEPHRETFSADELPLVAAGVAAGYVEIVEGDLNVDDHVESQEASEAKLAEHTESGVWQRGNVEQFVNDARARLDGLRDVRTDDAAQAVAFLDQGIAQSQELIEHLDNGADYETAVRRVLGQEPAVEGSTEEVAE